MKYIMGMAVCMFAFGSIAETAAAQDGSWTFRRGNNDAGTLEELQNRYREGETSIFRTNAGTGDGFWSVAFNSGEPFVDANDIHYPTMTEGQSPFVLHPGPGPDDWIYAVFEPTNAGEYEISVRFKLIDESVRNPAESNGVSYAIVVLGRDENGNYNDIDEVYQANGSITGFDRFSSPLTATLSLSSTQHLGVIVSNNGSYANDSTLVEAAVTPVVRESVPTEPLFTAVSGWAFGGGRTQTSEFIEFVDSDSGISNVAEKTGGGSFYWMRQLEEGQPDYTDSNGIQYTPGDIILHPGNGAERAAKIRYTAETAGRYVVDANVSMADAVNNGGQPANVMVYIYSTNAANEVNILDSREVTVASGAQQFDLSVDLISGAHLFLEVEHNGNQENDSTRVELNISRQN